jgi:hypothetical protein
METTLQNQTLHRTMLLQMDACSEGGLQMELTVGYRKENVGSTMAVPPKRLTASAKHSLIAVACEPELPIVDVRFDPLPLHNPAVCCLRSALAV